MISKIADIFIIITLITIIIGETRCKFLQISCSSASIRKIDSTVAKIITLGNTGRKFPENTGREFINFCNETETLIKEVEEYKTNCMKNLTKQVFGVLVYSTRKGMKQVCKNFESSGPSKTAEQLIDASKCSNKANNEFNRCYTKYIDSILGALNAENNKRIPFACCEYFKMFACMQERGRNVKQCTDTHLNTVIEFVRSINDNVIDLTCGDYTENSDKCEKLGAPPKKRRDQRRTKSFMIPLSELYASLSD